MRKHSTSDADIALRIKTQTLRDSIGKMYAAAKVVTFKARQLSEAFFSEAGKPLEKRSLTQLESYFGSFQREMLITNPTMSVVTTA